MKLGIAVVYLLGNKEERLLDLHFSQIEKHTNVPYRIYASVNRLPRRLRKKLMQNAKVKICDLPTTRSRSSREHAYYMDSLVRSAIEDGVTHVAMLHVDSFPVRAGWARELAARLSDSCVFAAVKRAENGEKRPNPTCIFFERDFYLKYKPALFAADHELTQDKYREYIRYLGDSILISDTGVGYGYRAFAEGLSWDPLLRSNLNSDHYIIASIYGDLIFHLGGVSRPDKFFCADGRVVYKGRARKKQKFLVSLFAFFLPRRLKDQLRYFLDIDSERERKRLDDINQLAYQHARKRLLEDPESYIKYLQGEK